MAYTALCAFLARWALRAAALGLVLLVLCVQWQVIGRYLLNDTPVWTEPVALLLLLYITALAVAVGVRDAGHLGLESLAVLRADAASLPPLELAAHEQIRAQREAGRLTRPAPLFEHARFQKFMREVFETVAYGKSTDQEAARRLVDEGNALLQRIR